MLESGKDYEYQERKWSTIDGKTLAMCNNHGLFYRGTFFPDLVDLPWIDQWMNSHVDTQDDKIQFINYHLFRLTVTPRVHVVYFVQNLEYERILTMDHTVRSAFIAITHTLLPREVRYGQRKFTMRRDYRLVYKLSKQHKWSIAVTLSPTTAGVGQQNNTCTNKTGPTECIS